MIRDIANYMNGSFVDYLGNERTFVVCALSISPEQNPDYEYCVGWVEDETKHAYETLPIKRTLQIGVSLCMPEDEFNQKKGEEIALKKAYDDHEAIVEIHVTKDGIINEEFVSMILNSQCDYIETHPEKVFKLYKEAKDRYELEEQLKETLTPEEWCTYLLARDKKVNLDDINAIVKG